MKKKMLNFLGYLVLSSLSALLLLPISAMAEGDGGWTTTASPGYHFLIEEDLYNNKKHLVMTVLYPDLAGAEVHWGPASGSVNSTYQLKSMDGNSDMIATWQFNSVTQATVTVESCSTNCLWQSGQVVTLNKFFGDKENMGHPTIVPKTGQTGCWDRKGNSIDCTGTGQDGEYQLGVLPAWPPSIVNPYSVYGWTGNRFADNLDGTVTDNLTGLIWLKKVDCYNETYWNWAIKYCKDLASGSCGLTDGSAPGDWRLPNANEMHSLIDPTQSNPALPTGHPFIGVPADTVVSTYWRTSTTEETDDPRSAFIVDLYTGHLYGSWKPNDLYHFWPVRGGN